MVFLKNLKWPPSLKAYFVIYIFVIYIFSWSTKSTLTPPPPPPSRLFRRPNPHPRFGKIPPPPTPRSPPPPFYSGLESNCIPNGVIIISTNWIVILKSNHVIWRSTTSVYFNDFIIKTVCFFLNIRLYEHVYNFLEWW